MRRCPKGTLTRQCCVCYYERGRESGTQSWGTLNLFLRRCTALQKKKKKGGVEINKEKRRESCGRLHNKKKGAEHAGDDTCAMTPHLFGSHETGVGSLRGGWAVFTFYWTRLLFHRPCACRMNHSQHRQTSLAQRKKKAGWWWWG